MIKYRIVEFGKDVNDFLKKVKGKMQERYWDSFAKRIDETVAAELKNTHPPLGRIALHITSRCNFRCDYCNEYHNGCTLPKELFAKIVQEYSQIGGGILHITGGEPTMVSWLDEAIQNRPENVTINLNSNCFKLLNKETYKFIDRIKVSLDTYKEQYFDSIVHHEGAFKRIVINLWQLENYDKARDTSITYTLTKENYQDTPTFLAWCYNTLPSLYAIFFSVYKGSNKRFLFTEEDQELFWGQIAPAMKRMFEINNDKESLWLFEQSYNAKTLSSSCKYPENLNGLCYISKSELTIDEQGRVWRCSHLFRDKLPPSFFNIRDTTLEEIHHSLDQQLYPQCLTGCNLKLVRFNQEVQAKINRVFEKNK